MEHFSLSIVLTQRRGITPLHWIHRVQRDTLTTDVCVSVSTVAEQKVGGVNKIMKDTGHKGAIYFKIYL